MSGARTQAHAGRSCYRLAPGCHSPLPHVTCSADQAGAPVGGAHDRQRQAAPSQQAAARAGAVGSSSGTLAAAGWPASASRRLLPPPFPFFLPASSTSLAAPPPPPPPPPPACLPACVAQVLELLTQSVLPAMSLVPGNAGGWGWAVAVAVGNSYVDNLGKAGIKEVSEGAGKSGLHSHSKASACSVERCQACSAHDPCHASLRLSDPLSSPHPPPPRCATPSSSTATTSPCWRCCTRWSPPGRATCDKRWTGRGVCVQGRAPLCQPRKRSLPATGHAAGQGSKHRRDDEVPPAAALTPPACRPPSPCTARHLRPELPVPQPHPQAAPTHLGSHAAALWCVRARARRCVHAQQPFTIINHLCRQQSCDRAHPPCRASPTPHPCLAPCLPASLLPDADATRLSAVPSGGVLVLCQHLVLYYRQGQATGVVLHPSALPPAAAPPPLRFDVHAMAEAGGPGPAAAQYAEKHALDVHPVSGGEGESDAGAVVVHVGCAGGARGAVAWTAQALAACGAASATREPTAHPPALQQETLPAAVQFCDGSQAAELKVTADGSCVAWLAPDSAMLCLRSGQLLQLAVLQQPGTGGDRRLAVARAGAAPPASRACSLTGDGGAVLQGGERHAALLFLGSAAGDSLLVSAATPAAAVKPAAGTKRPDSQEVGEAEGGGKGAATEQAASKRMRLESIEEVAGGAGGAGGEGAGQQQQQQQQPVPGAAHHVAVPAAAAQQQQQGGVQPPAPAAAAAAAGGYDSEDEEALIYGTALIAPAGAAPPGAATATAAPAAPPQQLRRYQLRVLDSLANIGPVRDFAIADAGEHGGGGGGGARSLHACLTVHHAAPALCSVGWPLHSWQQHLPPSPPPRCGSRRRRRRRAALPGGLQRRGKGRHADRAAAQRAARRHHRGPAARWVGGWVGGWHVALPTTTDPSTF